MFVAGQPKLADIGLLAETQVQTSFAGTPGYIPPEGSGSPQADIYSLGKVLYEASTGLDCSRFPSLPVDLEEWPEWNQFLELNRIVCRACQANLRRRYSTAREVYAHLLAIRTGESLRGYRRCRKWISAIASLRRQCP